MWKDVDSNQQMQEEKTVSSNDSINRNNMSMQFNFDTKIDKNHSTSLLTNAITQLTMNEQTQFLRTKQFSNPDPTLQTLNKVKTV